MNTMVAKYTAVQKLLAVVLLFSVFATTVLTTNLGFDGIFGKDAKAAIDGVITSFLDVPTEKIEVDAGITQDKIGLPSVIGAVVEKDGLSKKVYFDALWECADFSEATALHTEYVFRLASSSVPAKISEGVELPSVVVSSGKYCIKGFKEISADLVAKAVTPNEQVTLPATVEAFVGNDTEATNVKVNWVSFMETVEGGVTRAFTDIGSKHAFKAEIAETDKYYLSPELLDFKIAAYSVPFITLYVISDAVAFVGGTNGFANLTAAYDYINQNGGSGTIIINDHYDYFVSDRDFDPSLTIVKSMGDNYSDSYFSEPAHSGMVVIKGNTPNAVLEFSYRFYVNGDLMFKDIHLRTKNAMKERIYANGNDLVFGTGVTSSWGNELSEGYIKEYSNAFRIYGGSASTDVYGDTRVVLLSGDYYLVRGGNEEGGTVYGNTYVYLGGTAHTYYQLMGGSRRGLVKGSSCVIVNGNAVADSLSGGSDEAPNGAVFGGGLEGTVEGDRDGDGISEGICHALINGGTLNAPVTGTGKTGDYKANISVTVCGNAVVKSGNEGSVYGIGHGPATSTTGKDVLINVFCNAKLVSNGTTNAHIYGTNTSKVTNSNIVINVYGNASVEGSVNGGAFVANSGIGNEIFGKKVINVNIFDSAFVKFNVYGGSLRKGVYGDTNVTVKGNATVKGDVYGGGQGATTVNTTNEYGKAFDTTVLIEGNVTVGNVFGGGNYGYNTGNSTITVKQAKIGGSVYGGSSYGGVYGKSTVNIYNSHVEESVYGGNKENSVVYANSLSSEVNLFGADVKGSVYGGSKNSAAGNTTVNVTDSKIGTSVFGGSEAGTAENTVVNVLGSTAISGNVYGAGNSGNVNKATINVNSGFVNSIYGGGINGYSVGVEINVGGTEDDFTFEISGDINGLPQSPADDSEIASNFTARSIYVLNFNKFFGFDGKTFEGCGSVKSISNFSEVNVMDSYLTFVGTEGEYFTGITALNLDADSKLELPSKAVICSAFTEGGIYSTAKTNVLPATFNAEKGSAISMMARTLTDKEEIEANGKVSAILTVYGKIIGECDLHLVGEKKSGTYVTSFMDGSSVGDSIETSTSDYFYKNGEGVRTGTDRNFDKFMADGFDEGTFKMVGLDEVHSTNRVFTTVSNGSFGLLDSKNTANWIIWTAESYANIAIFKEGETNIGGTTAPLAGVEFTIYSDKECKNPIESVITNENGYAISSDLYANNVTYFVKETKTGDGYTLDEKVYSVTLTNEDTGKTVALTDSAIINYLKYGEIKIVKKSDDGVLLEGVSFLVTGPNGFSKTIVTDASGFASTGKVLYGAYTVEELSNPNPGFVAPSYVENVTIGDGANVITLDVTNNRVTGKVTLTKVDENGNTLSGVVFNVYSDESLDTLVDTITTNANGYAETKELTIYGASTTYYVVEAVAAEGFILRRDVFAVTLTPDSNVGIAADDGDRVIRNYFKKATIAISKKGVNDALLEGVVFGIYADKECTDLVETIVTDVAGSAVSKALKLGTYYVKEISNPDKTYIISETVYTFELTENGKVYSETVYNVKTGAYISLEKIDSHGNKMAGVKFEIRDAAGELVETIVTDENGKAISSAISITLGTENIFTVKEVYAPDYVFINDTTFEAILTENNQIFEINGGEPIVNKVKEGYLTLEKENEKGEKLSGVEFTVYSDKALTNVVATIVTDANGKGVSTNLPFGTYYVKETANPDKAYVIDTTIHTVEINEENGKVTDEKLYVPVSERPIVNFHAMGCISIIKQDEDGKALAGVEFTIYDSDMNHVSTVYTGADGKVTTCNLIIKDGVNGTKYYVVETATLDGYILDNTKYEAVLKVNGEIVAINAGEAIVNYYKRAQISILKKGENDALLEGVVFGVYADKECIDLVETIVTDAKGSAVSKALKLGTYYVKEISNPDKTYIVSETVYTFELTENGKVYSETVYNVKTGAYISLEKVDSHGNKMAGVKFEIRNAAGELVETIVTDENGKAISSAISIVLGTENRFTVKEVYAPDYVVINDTTFEAVLTENNQIFELNGGEPIVNKVKEGYITLEKRDEEGKPLAGVEFTIYADAECKNVVELITTDANGKGISSALKLGTYYVKETKAVAPYVPVYEVWSVTLAEDGKTESLTSSPIVNYYTVGNITLTKTDENGKPLAGVEFTVYTHSGAVVEVLVTDANGVATSKALPIKNAEGTVYIVKETKGINGYEMDSTEYTVLLKNDGETVAVNDGKAIINKKIKGSLTVTYKSENDADDQSVTVNVQIGGNAYVGEYSLNGVIYETTDGTVTVKDGDSFVIEMECGETYTVYASTDSLENLVSITYNGVEAENASGTITEENLNQRVDIVALFEAPAKPGDMGTIFFFSILAAVSAFGMAVLQSKKRRIRG